MKFATRSHSVAAPRASARLQPVEEKTSLVAGPGLVVALAAALGILGGLLELGVMLIKCRVIDGRLLYVSRHYPWMYPVAGLCVLAGPGILLAIFALLRRGRVGLTTAVGWLSFFVFLGLLFRAPIYTVACLLLAAGLAMQTGRLAARYPRLFLLLARQGLAGLLLLIAGLMAAAFGREMIAERRAAAQMPSAPASARNVLWIVLDTVRADHLSLYGYSRPTSPNLEQVAKEGTRFDLAIAAAPWTAASHAAMFTGHPCHDLSVSWQRALDGKYTTIAEALSSQGYRTAGFVANTSYCSYETGLTRGFGHYEDYCVTLRSIWLCSSVVQRTFNFVRRRLGGWGPFDDVHAASLYRKTAAVINADFLGWLDQRPRRPFFAFLNYYDAHHPYITPEPDNPHFGKKPESAADIVTLRTWWDADKGKLSPHQVELAKDAYDDCIASLDRQLGRLFEMLKQRGLWDNSIVLITADHGEHLGEHGLYGHGCSLARQEVHVPLLIVAPGLVPAGCAVKDAVSLCELPATVRDLLAIRGKTAFPGRSLARYWGAGGRGQVDLAAPVLSELDGPPEADPNHGASPARVGPLRSLWWAGAHYIRDGQGHEQLFDTAADAEELHDLSGSAEAQGLLEQLRQTLDSLVQQ